MGRFVAQRLASPPHGLDVPLKLLEHFLLVVVEFLARGFDGSQVIQLTLEAFGVPSRELFGLTGCFLCFACVGATLSVGDKGQKKGGKGGVWLLVITLFQCFLLVQFPLCLCGIDGLFFGHDVAPKMTAVGATLKSLQGLDRIDG